MAPHHFEDAGVVAVVVAHVVDDRVELREPRERRRVAPVVAGGEARAHVGARGHEAVHEEFDLGARRGEVRQQFFAVVGDARPLRPERAEVGQPHHQSIRMLDFRLAIGRQVISSQLSVISERQKLMTDD
jgi:hypothetical protein